MGNLNMFRFSRPVLKLAGSLLFLFIAAGGYAQAPVQSFKVEAPSEARSLEKDPVDNFLSFSPVYAEGKTYLRWLVENDRKDGVFIVERSDDGELFEALGFKDRVGTDKNVNLLYSWVDDAPPAGYAHYRVMQVGIDQTYNYSDVVRVKTAPAEGTGGKAEGLPSEK